MTFGAFKRDEEEGPVSQLLFVLKFLTACLAFNILPLELSCEPFCPSLSVHCHSSTAFCSPPLPQPVWLPLVAQGPLLGPEVGGHMSVSWLDYASFHEGQVHIE